MKKLFMIIMAICILTSCQINQRFNNTEVSNVENVANKLVDSGSKEFSFSTVDLNDNVINQDIFANKDITILNIWGTYCSPCINEMPELGTWNNELPSNVQIIGLIVDVDAETKYNRDTAIKIVNSTGANYTHLLYNESLQKILENVIAIPTTLFIDKEGNTIGDPIVGAYVDKYKEKLDKLLNE